MLNTLIAHNDIDIRNMKSPLHNHLVMLRRAVYSSMETYKQDNIGAFCYKKKNLTYS